jgi:hypothetical protein
VGGKGVRAASLGTSAGYRLPRVAVSSHRAQKIASVRMVWRPTRGHGTGTVDGGQSGLAASHSPTKDRRSPTRRRSRLAVS